MLTRDGGALAFLPLSRRFDVLSSDPAPANSRSWSLEVMRT